MNIKPVTIINSDKHDRSFMRLPFSHQHISSSEQGQENLLNAATLYCFFYERYFNSIACYIAAQAFLNFCVQKRISDVRSCKNGINKKLLQNDSYNKNECRLSSSEFTYDHINPSAKCNLLSV